MSNAEKSAAGSIIWNSTMFGKCLAAERMGEEKEKKNTKFDIQNKNMKYVYMRQCYIIIYYDTYILHIYGIKCIFQSRLHYLYFGLLLYIFKYMFGHLILLGQNDVKLTMKNNVF